MAESTRGASTVMVGAVMLIVLLVLGINLLKMDTIQQSQSQSPPPSPPPMTTTPTASSERGHGQHQQQQQQQQSGSLRGAGDTQAVTPLVPADDGAGSKPTAPPVQLGTVGQQWVRPGEVPPADGTDRPAPVTEPQQPGQQVEQPWTPPVSEDGVFDGPSVAAYFRRLAEEDTTGLWKAIWDNQHPPDCSKARFLVHFRGVGGLGYKIHLLARELEYALRSGRVLLFAGVWIFTDPALCPKRDWECYFQPLSSCTLRDIDPSYDASAPPPPEYNPIAYKWDQPPATLWPSKAKFPRHATAASEDDRVVAADLMVMKLNGVYPRNDVLSPQINSLIRSKPLLWRSIAQAYLLRPNLRLRKALSEYERQTQLAQPCMVAHVRRSDSTKKNLQPVDGALFLRIADKHRSDKNPPYSTILVQTEDPAAIEEMQQGTYKLAYTPHPRKNKVVSLYAGKDNEGLDVTKETYNSLANMFLSAQCEFLISTMKSSWSRLVYEHMYFVANGKSDKGVQIPYEDVLRDKWYVDEEL